MDDETKALRSALSSFATGVTVVTTLDAEGQPVGLTANSFSSVSLDPPLVLWSLALASPNLPAFRQSKAWAVHILGASQEEVSDRFATRGIAKFEGLEHDLGPEGAPRLSGCAARFGCRLTFEYEGGDHAIFVGEVVDFTHVPAAPLVFHGGRYGGVYAGEKGARPPELAHDGDFGRFFIAHLLNRTYHASMVDIRREYQKRGLRSADYSVIVSMGLGDGCTSAELVQRASNGGANLPVAAIERLLERGIIIGEQSLLYLSREGQTLLSELMAVAQSVQLKLEQSFEPYELGQLTKLLNRVSDCAASTFVSQP